MFGPFVAPTEVEGLRRAVWVGEVSTCIGEHVSDSQWRQARVIAWKMFAESSRVPWKLGWIPSLLKKDARPQNRFKLSRNEKLSDAQTDCSQVFRERRLDSGRGGALR